MPSANASGDSRFGVMTHFAQGWSTSWVSTASGYAIPNVRDELYWNNIETLPGVYSFPAAYDSYMTALKNAGISPLIELDFANSNYDGGNTPYTATGISAYARYAVAVLQHYGKQIKAVEVWNEYNGAFCTGPATNDRSGTYTKMLQAAYAQIKAVRPDVIVAGGGTIEAPLPYWEKLMQDGALASMDVLSIHPYRYDSAPEGIEQDIIALQNLTKQYNGGKTKPIWVTEVGWGIQDGSTSGQMAIDETTQAKFLVRAYALLLSAHVQRIYWYLLRDYQDFTLGLTHADATPKLSAYAMKTLIKELSGAAFVRRESTDPNVYSMLFQHSSGAQVRVVWAIHPVTVNLSVGSTTTMTSMTGNPLGAPYTVTLTDEPVFIDGTVLGLPPPPAIADVYLTDANFGFSGTQGKNGWSYGSFTGADVAAFEPMASYSIDDWSASWSNEYAYNDITPEDQHPSTTAGLPVSAVRRWTSNFTGSVRVTGNFQCSEGGDGIGVRVLVNGQPLFRKLIGGVSSNISYAFDFLTPVQVGTTIDFAADPGPGTDIDFDATPMTVTISKHSAATGLVNLSPTAWVYEGTLAGVSGTAAVSETPGTVLADSIADFSGIQGQSNWSYGDFVGGTTSWEAMTGFDGTAWGSSYPYISLTSSDQHPSTVNGQQVAAVRRWISTYAGPISVIGQFQCSTQGDGVGVSIYVNGQRLFRQAIGGTVSNTYAFSVSPTVQVGSTVDFVVDPGPGTNIDFDATNLTATISTE
ncbi:MAG TPA: glycosyl hydrolase [Opitutaceae bacterium]|nr:glycosyl hydrolase [Opitutaceae bacterium]